MAGPSLSVARFSAIVELTGTTLMIPLEIFVALVEFVCSLELFVIPTRLVNIFLGFAGAVEGNGNPKPLVTLLALEGIVNEEFGSSFI
jgi:hypothetical protein